MELKPLEVVMPKPKLPNSSANKDCKLPVVVENRENNRMQNPIEDFNLMVIQNMLN